MQDLSPQSGLADLGFAVVGCGRVGASLAAWLCASGARLELAAGRSQDSADQLCRRLGGQPVPVRELSTADLDLLLLAVPDPALAILADELASRPQARVALHTAGALPAAAIAALRRAGSSLGTFHPLKAFPRLLPDVSSARGLVFGLEGDEAALALAYRILAEWRAVGVPIPAESRRLYHFAATLAAGGVVTLLCLATEISRRLGLPEATTIGYRELALGAVGELDPAYPAAALTGPVARGDHQAVAAALTELETKAPELLGFAATLLAQTTRQLAIHTGALPRTELAGVLARFGGLPAPDPCCEAPAVTVGAPQVHRED